MITFVVCLCLKQKVDPEIVKMLNTLSKENSTFIPNAYGILEVPTLIRTMDKDGNEGFEMVFQQTSLD